MRYGCELKAIRRSALRLITTAELRSDLARLTMESFNAFVPNVFDSAIALGGLQAYGLAQRL